MRYSFLPATALALLLAQCHQDPPVPAKPEDLLPPATQTGAGTFGLLLNGQPWTPSGSFGPSNYRLIYDPTYAGGELEIRVYRINKTVDQYFLISGAPISKVGTYSIDNKTCGVYHNSGVSGPCYEYSNAPGLTGRGQLVISKLDLTQNIIAGTFAFNLWQPGCDTVKVTKGRFDYHL